MQINVIFRVIWVTAATSFCLYVYFLRSLSSVLGSSSAMDP